MTTATILTIDDEERSRSAIENLLHGQTYRLEFAHDGPSGLQRARELLPDLIILDVMMPGMSGFDVCQAIRADKVLQQIPVVMLTALDDSDSRLRAECRGRRFPVETLCAQRNSG
jgi:CheY-like chemotaxis protein